MKRLFISLVSIAAVLFSISSSAYAQGLKGRWGIGAAFGAHQFYNDFKVTPFGPGGDVSLSYRLSDRVSLGFVGGYNVLHFKPLGSGTPTASTNLFFGDLIADYELAGGGTVRPFISGGVGAINFRAPNKGRFYDGEFVAGGGLRVFVNPQTALMFAGDAKLTTGDDLDNSKKRSMNDAYFSLRSGVTFYMGKKATMIEEDMFTDSAPVDQLGEGEGDLMDFGAESGDEFPTQDGGEYDDFLARLSALDGGDDSNLTASSRNDVRDVKMEEYLRLKSKIDELSGAIEGKESEIRGLATGAGNGANRQPVPSSYAPPVQVEVSNFSAAYEEALNQFYRRRYSDAISIFTQLLERHPNHSLASNCEYWIGESYFGAGNYQLSVQAFERVLQYPKSLKKDDALMMMGRAYLELNVPGEAQQAFNRLIRDYPESEFVVKSEQYLRKL